MDYFFPYRETKGTADGTAISKVNIDAEKGTRYVETPNNVLVSFVDAGYLSEPHKGRSQTRYLSTIRKQQYFGD